MIASQLLYAFSDWNLCTQFTNFTAQDPERFSNESGFLEESEEHTMQKFWSKSKAQVYKLSQPLVEYEVYLASGSN